MVFDVDRKGGRTALSTERRYGHRGFVIGDRVDPSPFAIRPAYSSCQSGRFRSQIYRREAIS